MEFTVTIIIVIITCLVSFGAFSNQKIMDDLIFYPPAISNNQYYRFLTHGLIHADLVHLGFNMMALYSFGEAVESALYSNPCVFGEKGKMFYAVLYVTALIVASLPDYTRHRNSYHFRSLGASGAVSAVIFASIVLLPQIPIRFFFVPVDIPGFIFGILYLAVTVWLDKKGKDNINHSAHFWGAAYGIVFTIVCCYIFGKMNVYENFARQIQSLSTFLPFECDF